MCVPPHSLSDIIHMFAGCVVLQGSDIELQLVLLDTVQLCGDSGDDHFNTQPQGKLLYYHS